MTFAREPTSFPRSWTRAMWNSAASAWNSSGRGKEMAEQTVNSEIHGPARAGIAPTRGGTQGCHQEEPQGSPFSRRIWIGWACSDLQRLRQEGPFAIVGNAA